MGGAVGNFWLKALSKGVGQLNSAAGLVGAVILVLGIAAGIAVPQVSHISHWLTAVVLLCLLVVVLALGSYRVWSETDEASKAAAAGGAAQARLVGVWKTAGPLSGWWTPQVVYIHVKNGSDKRITNLVCSWRLGTDPDQWGDPDLASYVLQPGETTVVSRKLPKDRPSGPIKKTYTADVYFQDDNGVYWCTTPREDSASLVKRSPDQELSPA